MRPRAGTLAALSLAIALAGCGGGSGTMAEEPALPRAIASDLASQSDAIADALDDEDVCRAAELADELKDAVDAAVAGGRVPPAFQRELEQTATELQNEVNCEEHENRGKGKGKKKGHDNDGETTTLGTTVSTTTEASD